jgi:hypothetical protein
LYFHGREEFSQPTRLGRGRCGKIAAAEIASAFSRPASLEAS